MSSALEQILLKLLVPDNVVIQQGTEELKQALKSPGVVPELCSVLTTSQNPQVRQFAAVLLRRLVRRWKKFSPDFHISLKQISLQVLQHENERVVRNSVAQLAAAIARYELADQKWPEILQYIQEGATNPNPQQRELSSLLLSCIVSTSANHLRPFYKGLFHMFDTMLVDTQSKNVPFYAVKTMTALVHYTGTDEIPLFRPLIPKVLAVIDELLVRDEDQGCEAMEVFDELVECEVSIIVPHLKSVLEFCCQVASNGNLGNNARVKALSFISWLTKLKKKTILKNKLVMPILNILFPIMCEPTTKEEEDEEEDDNGEEVESSSPSSYAAQVLDTMALHLPPDKLVPHLLQLVQPALESEDPYHKKAGLVSLAVLAEGCADYVCKKHLEQFLESICNGIRDTRPLVYNAGLFALGQFSEHLQPEISRYHNQLLPLLFGYLAQTSSQNAEQRPKGITRIYYALEMFCENLGTELVPYLPTLMEHLLTMLHNAQDVQISELAISAIGAAGNAASEHMLPFFHPIMEQLKHYLTNVHSGDSLILQIQSIDTLGVLARKIGKENFMPLTEECILLGLKLIDQVNDPDLRRCTYNLFASIASVLEENMSNHLPVITQLMLDSLRSTDGVVPHFDEEESRVQSLFEDINGNGAEGEEDFSDTEDEDEDDDEIQGYNVENSYLEEKEDTCNAMAEVALHTKAAFLPFIEECYNEVYRLMDYPAPGIRKAATVCSGQLCCTLGQCGNMTVSSQADVLSEMLEQVVPHFVENIDSDSERSVVITTLEGMKELLEAIGPEVVKHSEFFTAITGSIKNVLQQKTACQDEDEEEEEEDEGEQAEKDAILVECAGDLIPTIIKALDGKQDVAVSLVTEMLPLLVSRTKKSCPSSDKSFASGILAETVCAMKGGIAPFAETFLTIFIRLTQDSDEEVRSNAVFGLGVLAEHGKDTIYQHFSSILRILSDVMGREANGRVIDNVCASVCRLITANHTLVPVDQLVPTLLKYLPLREDMEENSTVYSCLGKLYEASQVTLVQSLPQLLNIYAQALTTQEVSDEVRLTMVHTLQLAKSKQPDEFSSSVSTLPPEVVNLLSNLLMQAT
ncbi:importin-4-like isoform X1 [Lytechinus pictus]|uniref:importin-4-like isoform X1 n=2 Tax=Lytechinus pictus TaxID=7653 RepID=UPI0030B9C196